MKAAIIAAGRGERLRAAGVATPKPLLPIAGIPLIARVIDAVAATGVREVVCVLNEDDDSVAHYCHSHRWGVDLRLVRRSTPNSMESLFALAPALERERFLLLTVDAVFGPAVLPRFLRSAAAADADGVLAVHGFVDDEKPLFVETDGAGRIVALGADVTTREIITAGFYIFDHRIFAEVPAARSAGLASLREFLGWLLQRQYRLVAAAVAPTIDVDRLADIRAAEELVRRDFRS